MNSVFCDGKKCVKKNSHGAIVTRISGTSPHFHTHGPVDAVKRYCEDCVRKAPHPQYLGYRAPAGIEVAPLGITTCKMCAKKFNVLYDGAKIRLLSNDFYYCDKCFRTLTATTGGTYSPTAFPVTPASSFIQSSMREKLPGGMSNFLIVQLSESETTQSVKRFGVKPLPVTKKASSAPLIINVTQIMTSLCFGAFFEDTPGRFILTMVIYADIRNADVADGADGGDTVAYLSYLDSVKYLKTNRTSFYKAFTFSVIKYLCDFARKYFFGLARHGRLRQTTFSGRSRRTNC